MVVLLACSSNDGPPADGGSDAGADAMFDAANDAGDDAGEADAGDDAGETDGGDDAGEADAGDDAGDVDAGDADDAGIDAPFDAGMDGALSYLVFRDFRRCAAPLCGGFWVQAVNHTVTVCADGTSSADGCYVGGINWSTLSLSDEERSLAEATAGSLIIDGTLETRSFEPGGVELGSIVVDAAWGAPWGPAMTRPSNERFYNATDNGISCLVPPCFNRDLAYLNTGVTDVVSAIDLTMTAASAEQLTLAGNALSAGNLRVAGTITDDTEPGPSGDFGRTLEAIQFYLPILPE